jgi:hypothetical protein
VAQGFVYILVSPESNFIKIGGTERPISERIRGINGTPSYAEHGPWQLSDFLHVTDWRLVEGGLHRHFQDRKVKDAPGTQELFSVPAHEARTLLLETAPDLRIDHEKTEQLFANRDALLYLYKLFQLSGLFGNLDIQGSWTLSVLPKTKGGRWFTLNIGPHEVAFTTRKANSGKFTHYLVLDKLILDYPDTIIWIGNRAGQVEEAHYASAEHSIVINYEDDFASAEKLFKLPGVRRALIAYWSDSLADLRERQASSVYARYHSYDAVSALLEYKHAADKITHGATVTRQSPA